MELGIGAIGGKDSMSGSFEKLDVPPTLVSFAVTTGKTGEVVSPNSRPRVTRSACDPAYDENSCPKPLPAGNLRYRLWGTPSQQQGRGRLHPGMGGIAESRDEDGLRQQQASPLTTR